jgi:hypothetical protein
MSKKITKIEVVHSESGSIDTTFYFAPFGTEPFSSSEYVTGSRTREILEQIENLIEELTGVS